MGRREEGQAVRLATSARHQSHWTEPRTVSSAEIKVDPTPGRTSLRPVHACGVESTRPDASLADTTATCATRLPERAAWTEASRWRYMPSSLGQRGVSPDPGRVSTSHLPLMEAVESGVPSPGRVRPLADGAGSVG